MIFFDAHVHLYPGYDRDRLFDALAGHARRLAPQAGRLAMALMLREGQVSLAAALAAAEQPGQRWRVVRDTLGPACLVSDGATDILVLAARQIAARERIELLGLMTEAAIPDGLPLQETAARLRAAGARPVLAWGLGKWLFKRGRIIRALLDSVHDPRDLMVCDSAMRPAFWGRPRLMALAQSRGLRLIHGSDPLPRAGEEALAGGYASLIAGDWTDADPVADMRRLLLNPAVAIRPVGRRHGLMATLRRIG